jgi:hypothetical protein
MMRMSVFTIEELNKKTSENDQVKARLDKKLQDLITQDVCNEIMLFNKCTDILRNIYENGHIFKTNEQLEYLYTSINCINTFYNDMFNKNSDNFDDAQYKQFRAQISKNIAEDRYGDLLDKIDLLKKESK